MSRSRDEDNRSQTGADRVHSTRDVDFESDPLLDSLRDALRPVPLNSALLARIESKWSPAGRLPWRVRLAWLAPALAAAVLALLFVLPAGPGSRPGPAVTDLSDDDADAVFTAFAEGSWYGPSDVAIDRLLERVEDLSAALSNEGDGRSADDWDLPLPRAEDSSPGSGRARGDSQVVS